MPFTAGQMETAWFNLMQSIGDSEWVDVVSSATGEHYRLPLAVGTLRHWNRTTGAWDDVTGPVASLIPVTVRFL